MAEIFDHEKLRVYQASLEFLKWLYENKILKRIHKGLAVHGHLDKASTSSSLNIAV